MIGNLFNAVSIALMSGVMALGGVRSAPAVTQGTSWVTGQECVVYAQKSYSIRNSSSTFVNGTIYNFDGVAVDSVDIPANSNIFVGDWWYKMLELNDSWSDFSDYDENCYVLCTQRFASPLTIGSGTYYYAMRFGISPYSNVNGFEFRSNANCTVFPYGASFDGLSYSYVYQGKQPVQNSIGIYDFSTSASLDEATLLSVTHNDLRPYRFISFLVLFGQYNSSVSNPTNALEVSYQLINTTNDANYNAGYNQGYTIGSSEGYSKGYSAGLSVSQNSSFMGLFSSIADTPLRFIYGIFNFDLFGISCLVIVLSLLTGIIVFGVVKKFWK